MTGCIVWFTGLPASGKTTAAQTLAAGLPGCCILDSDEVRSRLFPQLGYTDSDRDEFYRALAELATLLAEQDHVVLVAATAHRRVFRDRCRERVARFMEVLVDADPGQCKARDFKKLYGVADKLPGGDIAYEPPEHPDAVLHGGRDTDGLMALQHKLEQLMSTA